MAGDQESRKGRRTSLRSATEALFLHVGVTGYWVALFPASQSCNEGQKLRTQLPLVSHILQGVPTTGCQQLGPDSCLPPFPYSYHQDLFRRDATGPTTMGLPNSHHYHQTYISIDTHLIILKKKKLNMRSVHFLEDREVVRKLWSLLKTIKKKRES